MTALIMLLAFVFFVGKLVMKLFVTVRDNSEQLWSQSSQVARVKADDWRLDYSDHLESLRKRGSGHG
jgi:hypothetical protein